MPRLGVITRLLNGPQLPPPLASGSVPDLITPATGAPIDSQIVYFEFQVYRDGNWVSLPVISAEGSLGKAQAGQLTVKVFNDITDPYRSQLYENEKVRAYRGKIGSPPVRCWTGYVDSPTATDQVGVSREFIVTDYLKDFNDAILLGGMVFDTMKPPDAIKAVMQHLLDTQQFKPTDDNGVLLSSTANIRNPVGNPLVYVPDIINADGSIFKLASGTLGSFTQSLYTPYSTVMVPPAGSGASYSAFIMPNQYIIPSSLVIYPPFYLLPSGGVFPPPPSYTMVDCYNGLMYFNPADASRTVSFSGFFFSSPLWAYPPGSKIGDVISELMDKTGYKWFIDGTGKLQSFYIDLQPPLKRVFRQGGYISHGVQKNRDRRNVIVCEGWDGTNSTLIVSKAVNSVDILNPPPKGLGKRAYMIAQDQTWVTQQACNLAAYFGINQLSRRGKIATMEFLDDPTINLEDVLAFVPSMPEMSESDLFYVEQIKWTNDFTGEKVSIKSQLTGTMLPAEGIFSVGPPRGLSTINQFNLADDHLSINAGKLDPPGGAYYSTFSIATGSLSLSLTLNANASGVAYISVFGSDDTQQTVTDYPSSRFLGPINLMSLFKFKPYTFYSVRVRFEEKFISAGASYSNGNVGFFRSSIQALP